MNNQNITTMSTLKEDINLIEIICETESDSSKLKGLISNSDREVLQWILGKNIKTWNDLKMNIKELDKMENDINTIVKQLIAFISPNENVEDYIQFKAKQLKNLKIDQKIIIEYLSKTIWPGEEKCGMKLKQSADIDTLIYNAKQISNQKEEKKKFSCSFCSKIGHYN